MLLAHVLGLPVEELLGSLTSGALSGAAVTLLASIAALVRHRGG